MCGRMPPKLHNIIKVAGERSLVSSQTSVLTYLTSRLSEKARAVEEFALHLLYGELEFLPSGRGFRLLKGKSKRVRNSFI